MFVEGAVNKRRHNFESSSERQITCVHKIVLSVFEDVAETVLVVLHHFETEGPNFFGS